MSGENIRPGADSHTAIQARNHALAVGSTCMLHVLETDVLRPRDCPLNTDAEAFRSSEQCPVYQEASRLADRAEAEAAELAE